MAGGLRAKTQARQPPRCSCRCSRWVRACATATVLPCFHWWGGGEPAIAAAPAAAAAAAAAVAVDAVSGTNRHNCTSQYRVMCSKISCSFWSWSVPTLLYLRVMCVIPRYWLLHVLSLVPCHAHPLSRIITPKRERHSFLPLCLLLLVPYPLCEARGTAEDKAHFFISHKVCNPELNHTSPKGRWSEGLVTTWPLWSSEWNWITMPKRLVCHSHRACNRLIKECKSLKTELGWI